MMGKVMADITMSLDGYITGANPGPEQGLGEGGERLHEWIYDLDSWRAAHGMEGGSYSPDSDVLSEAFQNVGAVLMGRNMFDHAIDAWGEEPPFRVPVFVLTHRPQPTLEKKGGTRFIFVSEGLESALAQARAAAWEKDVAVAGGADVIQQLLNAGAIDEIQVHIAPMFLGAGVPLFDNLTTPPELEVIRVLESPRVTHLKYRIVK